MLNPCSMDCARGSSSAPAGVSKTFRVVRAKSLSPRSA
jgi:hypothetical protein